jgi:sec-independent protein translocase protein TatC
MGFHNYYSEIKNRIVLLIATWASVILVSYIFKEVLLYVITKQNLSTKFDGTSYFIFTDVSEIFSAYVFLIFFLVKQVFMIYIFYHLLIFLSPGLTKVEYNYLTFIFKTVVFLFFLSIIVFNKFLFPLSWSFFLSFKNFEMLESITLYFEAKLSEYLTFYVTFYYMCLLYFQIFLILILLFKYFGNKLTVYKRFRKFFYYLCVIFSTSITPPDVVSQLISSVAIIISCEFLLYCFIVSNVLR